MSDRNPHIARAIACTWRGLTGPCTTCGEYVLSFDCPGARPLRLRLSGADLAQIAGAHADLSVLDQRVLPTCCQSSSSSGSPHFDGSTPEDGQNVVPPTRSSSADTGE